MRAEECLSGCSPLPDLTQKPIRSQNAVIRDRDGRPRSEFVRSRNPVTVIVKIEGFDLDRRPAFGRCWERSIFVLHFACKLLRFQCDQTSVKIYLPAADDQQPQVAELVEAPPQGAGQAVLLVEDDPSVRLLIGELLAELGYRTIEASDVGVSLTARRRLSIFQWLSRCIDLRRCH
jgi:hypothetical protein